MFAPLDTVTNEKPETAPVITIEAIFFGEPKNITDEKGTWLSAIFRSRGLGSADAMRQAGTEAGSTRVLKKIHGLNANRILSQGPATWDRKYR